MDECAQIVLPLLLQQRRQLEMRQVVLGVALQDALEAGDRGIVASGLAVLHRVGAIAGTGRVNSLAAAKQAAEAGGGQRNRGSCGNLRNLVE